jgi:hypothetical protein
MLTNELEKTRELIETIDNTVKHLQGSKQMKDNQFFKGLNSPKQKEYEKYLIESGKHTAKELEAQRERLGRWQDKDWQKAQTAWEQLLKNYVNAMEKGPDSPAALECVKCHLEYLQQFFKIETKKEELIEKANFYLGHPDWQKVFDQHHPRLGEFILAAMQAYATS